MAKDRAAPFSFKHKRTWLTVTGGMVAIGIANVALGAWLWPDEPIDRTPERLIPSLPTASPGLPAAAGSAAAPDAPPAGVSPDAGTAPDAPVGAGPAAVPSALPSR